MSESDDIVGLTFSEFAFVVAFILILLLVASSQSAAQLRVRLTDVAAQRDKAEARVTELEQELAKRPPPELRSRQRPSCIEKKVASGFLFRATIVGPGQYVIGASGTSVTLPQLMGIYAAEIDRATQADCVHSVEAGYRRDVSLPDYDRALNLLEQQFYLRRLGPVDPQ